MGFAFPRGQEVNAEQTSAIFMNHFPFKRIGLLYKFKMRGLVARATWAGNIARGRYPTMGFVTGRPGGVAVNLKLLQR